MIRIKITDKTISQMIMTTHWFAIGWLMFSIGAWVHLGRIEITNTDWILLFILVAIYAPYLFSMWMGRMWRKES